MTTAYFCENDHRWNIQDDVPMKEQFCPECGQQAYRCLNLDNVKTLQNMYSENTELYAE